MHQHGSVDIPLATYRSNNIASAWLNSEGIQANMSCCLSEHPKGPKANVHIPVVRSNTAKIHMCAKVSPCASEGIQNIMLSCRCLRSRPRELLTHACEKVGIIKYVCKVGGFNFQTSSKHNVHPPLVAGKRVKIVAAMQEIVHVPLVIGRSNRIRMRVRFLRALNDPTRP